MSTQINPFSFDSLEVRTSLDENQNPWFCAKDVCEVLDINWTGHTLDNIPEDWKLMVKLTTSFGEKETNFINEAGLFNLVFRSNKPNAKEFANFVCSEVLPSIRKHGFYFAQNSAFASLQTLLNPKATPLTLEEFNVFHAELKQTTHAVIDEALKNIPVTLTALEFLNRQKTPLAKNNKPYLTGGLLPRWTDEEDERLLDLRTQRFTIREIANEMGRTFYAVQQRARVLRLKAEAVTA
jgi:prophage antirepressor-like protein